MNTVAPTLSPVELSPAELAQLERHLTATLPARRLTERGPCFWWRGIYLTTCAEGLTVLHAVVNSAADFVAEHGLPCTHQRAKEIADEACREWEPSFDDAFSDAFDRWQADRDDAAEESRAEDMAEDAEYLGAV